MGFLKDTIFAVGLWENLAEPERFRENRVEIHAHPKQEVENSLENVMFVCRAEQNPAICRNNR